MRSSPNKEGTDAALAALERAGLKLGRNWKKEIAELLNDIAAKEATTREEVIGAPEIEKILHQSKATSTQKLEKIREYLFAKKYPRYTSAKTRFYDGLKKLKLSGRIRVTPPPFFETKRIRVEFEFDTAEDMKTVMDDLSKLKEADLVNHALGAEEDNN